MTGRKGARGESRDPDSLPPRKASEPGAQSERDRLGLSSERLARDLLIGEGYEILAQRFRTRLGEVDIIAREGGVLCFVEVRSRRLTRLGSPEDTVSWRKHHRIEAAAREYIARERLFDEPARFDLVAVDWSGDEAALRLIRDAFDVQD